ncbi:MAG TPA: hypothetical protein VEL77_15210 [Rugosimonospora sp.]|nr:hypothetical protein [Rugosimonospora sp.]
MPYSTTTLASARAQLLERLEDPNAVYFGDGGSPANANRWIQESLRTWQALTASYKDRGTFNTVANQAFYDLPTVLSSLLAYTVTDRDAVDAVLAHLLEPALSAIWTGTGQFTFAAIAGAIQARLNRFQGDSGVCLTRITQAGVGAGRTALADSITDIRRVAWLTGGASVLWRDDEYGAQSFRFNAAPVTTPVVYAQFDLAPVAIEMYPPPLATGTVELIAVAPVVTVGGSPATVYNTSAILGIPDDFAWAVTWGALADLLALDGPGKDIPRAQYAESRYAEAVQAARMNPTVLMTQVASAPVWSGSVFELDAFSTSWEATTGTPSFAGMAGRNLVAMGPVADGTYTVTMDVTRNAIMPANDSDYLQITKDAIDPLLDYAQHIASFRMGGSEFAATARLRANFMTAAAEQNSRLRNLAFFRPSLEKPARLQSAEAVRM